MQGQLAALVDRPAVKEFYTTEEFAKAAGFQSAKTVRDYLADGRLRGVKKRNGRGTRKTWAIPHEELLRFQEEGLLDAC